MMQTIERAFAVLRALAQQAESAGISELARRTGLPKSTTSRILASLDELGMVERVGERYTIGPGLATLTHRATPVTSLRDVARPYLVELATAVGESVNLAIPDGDEIVYIDTVQVDGVLQVKDWTGQRFPCHTVAAGLVFLATWNGSEIARYSRRDFECFTDLTIADGPQLKERLKHVRTEGVAWTRAEFDEELYGVAAAVKDAGGATVGAINISGPMFRFPGARPEREIVELLLATSTQVSERLSGL